ncbi:MAG: hypothetical protein JF565_06275 [Propionibacteriales bacterium]|nr:hypothetical protein [Propionibacteriales bacterium]
MTATHARVLRRFGAITGVVALAGLATAPVFAADSGSGSGSVKVVNTETIQVYMSASGDIQSKRVYEQLALSGHGSVDLKNPVSTDGLRNIDGFRGFEVKDGEQIVKTTVDGTKHYRSVSNFTGTLPVSVTTEYTLDGKKVSPGDVVGKSGKLAVKFVVTNKTSTKQDVTVADGSGGTVTKTVDVPVPMVGSLTTTAPSNFTNVDPGGASTAGDGAGGTTMSYTMTLFPPLGSDSATLGYTADITDGVVPRVDVALLPVDPLSSPTFKSAGESYQGGADTGAQLVTGAGTIDGNLLKLRDGAADLLAGLIKLSDGADQLNDGLANDAAPGAKKLAKGAGDLDNGLGRLEDGSLKLANGAGDLADGTGDALAGGKQLSAGLQQISGGLGQLAGQMPAAAAGITQLKNGLDQIIAGFGDATQPLTILGGLKGMELGIGDAGSPTTLVGGVTAVKGGLQQLTGPSGLPAAQGGVDAVKSGLDGLLASGQLDTMVGALTSLKALCGLTPDPTCGPTFDAIVGGLAGAKTDLQDASGGLGAVSAGLGSAISGINTQMIPGTTAILGGLAQLLGGVQQLETGAGSAKAGAQQVRTGLDGLGAGIAAAIAGITQLNSGASAAATGSNDLVDGLGQLDDGAGQLSAGASDLSSGASDAADGSGQIADGADQLANGLGDAADGSGQIADGLKTASGSTPQLVDGAKRLSTEGMGQLIKAGKDTAVNYGELYAVIKAGSERAQTSSMAYGAPAGAEGLTAYAFTLKGEDGEGTRNLTRGVGALALLGLGAGVCVMRRRLA